MGTHEEFQEGGQSRVEPGVDMVNNGRVRELP